MTERMLFGEYLGRVVQLSEHDILEILEDQSSSRRRFGEIALSWGLCQPQDVWQAWWHQLSHRTPEVDLSAIGIDSQATASVPRGLALEFGVVPVRSLGDQLVLAVARERAARAAQELPGLLRRQIQLVHADPDQVAKAIARYYERTVTPAALTV